MAERCLKRVDAPDDRISDLPDDIRLHILSFLTTKSAVKAGVLSRRWARLWASSPVLLFDQKEFLSADHREPPSTTTSFVNFVDRVLALRSRSGSIRRFELRWYLGHDISKATTWLYYAMSYNVRELVLTMPSTPTRQVLVLPSSLFCSPSLEHCVIQTSTLTKSNRSHYAYKAVLRLPSSVSLSKLRELTLDNMITPTSFLGKLIPNCPVLEVLLIALSGHGVVHTSAPNLRKFVLRCNMLDKDSRIQISAPRLKCLLCLFIMVLPEIDLGNLHSLASTRIYCSKNQDGNGAKLLHILTSFRNAKTLSLEGAAIESLSLVPDLSKHMALPSCCLKYLKMEALLNEDNIQVINILIKSFTNLEKLVIDNSKDGLSRSVVNGPGDVCWFPQKLDYDCNFYHLKEITINGFLGSKDEHELMKLLLQCASTLRSMILKYKRELWNHETWIEISQNLYNIPRASSTAEILLSPMD